MLSPPLDPAQRTSNRHTRQPYKVTVRKTGSRAKRNITYCYKRSARLPIIIVRVISAAADDDEARAAVRADLRPPGHTPEHSARDGEKKARDTARLPHCRLYREARAPGAFMPCRSTNFSASTRFLGRATEFY